ncbi:MAG: TonB-dependent receptor [Bacteroidales bacterium]|nr:TonB-dependent receptor [Bacteroidales bacterium]
MKHNFFILLLIVLLTVFHYKGKAQDTLHISEVIKTATRQSVFKNTNEEVVDSLAKSFYKNSSLDELLSVQTSSQIKSYGGLGNLSSISIRGSAANHVSVNWNGFPVNSATTGTIDLSLIHTGFFEEIKIIPGASSSLYGSGTFGGAVELNNISDAKKGFTVSIGSEIGSFMTAKYFLSGNYSNKNLQYKLALNKTDAKNDFPYNDIYKIDKPVENRKHNSLNSINLIQNIKIKLPKNNTIESGIWYIIKDKEIPEIAGSYSVGNKMQSDSIFRTFLRWEKLNRKSLLTASSAYFSEYLHYTDKINADDTEYFINSEIKSNTFFGDVSCRYYFNSKLTVDFAGIINYQNIFTSNYTESQTDEINYSLLTALKYNIFDFDINFSFRNEFSEQIGYIPLIDLGISRKLLKNKLILKSNVSNKFRRPTFNEKFWLPGGNPNIKSETGKSTEATIKYLFNKNKSENISITGYYSKINNMIQWIPVNGVWTAVNNNEVQLSGIETNMHYSIQKNKFKYSINASYNFSNSLLTGVYSNNNLELPVKLMYSPSHSSKLFFTTSYKRFNISISEQYTGERFTTQDKDNNSEGILPLIFLSNIYAAYQFDVNNIYISLNAKILNIFNEQYEIIKSYPSSGRAFYFGVVVRYNKKKQDADCYDYYDKKNKNI